MRRKRSGIREEVNVNTSRKRENNYFNSSKCSSTFDDCCLNWDVASFFCSRQKFWHLSHRSFILNSVRRSTALFVRAVVFFFLFWFRQCVSAAALLKFCVFFSVDCRNKNGYWTFGINERHLQQMILLWISWSWFIFIRSKQTICPLSVILPVIRNACTSCNFFCNCRNII